MQQPRERRVHVNGIDLTIFEWGTRESETILLVHATGFHARCWDQVVQHLPGSHVIAVDLRGHGRSEKSGPWSWAEFGEDISALVAAERLSAIVGVGHSMGGHLVTQAAAAYPSAFLRLLLVDPVTLAPEAYRDGAARRMAEEPHPVARRRNRFASPEEMVERIGSRGSYALWDPRVLEDYCRHGLLPAVDGDGYELACPPEVEATIYQGSAGTNVHHLAAAIELPVTILRAKQRSADSVPGDFSLSPTWPGLAEVFPRGRDVPLPHLTHFIPMQEPALVATYIRNESP